MYFQLISRKDAKKAGLKRYFTGVPCPCGKLAERYVASCFCTCVDCTTLKRQMTAEWRQRNKSHTSDYNRSRYLADPEAARQRARDYRDANPDVAISYRKRDYQQNKESILARTEEWRRNNPEKEVARKRRYRSENQEKVAAYEKRYREENRALVNQRSRDYGRRNRDKVLAKASARYAKQKMALPAWYGELDHFAFQEAHSLRKLRSIETGILWHIDHMIPMQAEQVCGLHTWSNIQVIPAVLNMMKGNRLIFTEPGEWLKA